MSGIAGKDLLGNLCFLYFVPLNELIMSHFAQIYACIHLLWFHESSLHGSLGCLETVESVLLSLSDFVVIPYEHLRLWPTIKVVS